EARLEGALLAHVEHLAELGLAPLRPDPALHEHPGAIERAHEDGPHREEDPVLLVGRRAALPEDARDDAEHGPAVEAERPGVEEVELEVADLRGREHATIVSRPIARF